MFKYTKRLFSDIRFWCQELKTRSKTVIRVWKLSILIIKRVSKL